MRSFRPQERQLLILLALVNFTHILDFVIMMPLGPQLMRTFSITAGQFGLLVSAYTVSASLSGLFGSFFLDRFDRRTVLLNLYIGFIVGTFFCAIASSYILFLLARCVAGIFGGMMGAMIFSIIGDAISPDKRGTATGIIMSAFSIASVVGIPLGLWLAQTINWHAPFLAICIVGILVLLWGYKTMPSMKEHMGPDAEETSVENWLAMIKKPTHLLSNLFIATLMLSNFMIIPFISPSLVTNVGIKESDLFYVYLVGGLINFFSAQMIGRLCDRVGHHKVFYITAVLSFIPIYLVTNMTVQPLASAVLMVTLFMVMSSGRMVPALAIINSVVSPKIRGRFMSFNTAVQQMSAGLAAFLGSMIVITRPDGSIGQYERVGWVALVFGISTIGVCWLLRPAKLRN